MSEKLHKPFRVFVDTEFTDFVTRDLISIALVAEDGAEFYGENEAFNRSACSEFVVETVIPQLGEMPDRVFSMEALRTELLLWLSQFSQRHEPRLCFDYVGDWELFLELVRELPDPWTTEQVLNKLDHNQIETYYQLHGGRHHALHDARANRFAFMPD
jgi:hypothetical protein